MATVTKYFVYPTDRDTGRWKLDLNETQRRREVFWELYVYDSWQASVHRRASISINVHSYSVSPLGVHQPLLLPM